ncbi:helix-turn-helix domain-containing protein [Flavobacterium sp.]|uniref:helix-turn-helix domain-containing protein n=1 Tax=Flavobacterium sp. TaxID=239 RepID=UPI0037C17D35
MKLYIKFMVSLRCKMLVKQELKNLGIHYSSVDLGLVEIIGEITEDKRNKLKAALLKSGLELMDDKKSILIEKIKIIITKMIHYNEELPKVKYSEYISNIMGYDYTYLANVFSEVEGITIEHYIIAHKIEKVKELLIYDELNLSEISYSMNYSSVSHLSTQFKKVTGLTPTYFKNLKEKRRINLEKV